MARRLRKSKFVRLFTKTPPGVVCPHFFELILSNGCPFDCLYCYLKLTFRGKKNPVVFTNPWEQVKRELDLVPGGVFSTGELADSLAVIPPLLLPALTYFRQQKDKYILLVTKSINTHILDALEPSEQIIVSFSVNSISAWEKFEKKTPHPHERLRAAERLKKKGWRVRIRIDPIIYETGIDEYKGIAERVRDLDPEVVTIGTLRHYPGLFAYETRAPRNGLKKASDGRMRYSFKVRKEIYERMACWLGFQPALCKETCEMWKSLKWNFNGCNCSLVKPSLSQGAKFCHE